MITIQHTSNQVTIQARTQTMGQKEKKRIKKAAEKEEKRVRVARARDQIGAANLLANQARALSWGKTLLYSVAGIMLGVRAVRVYARARATLVRGAPDGAPLVESRRDVFGRAVAASLRSCALNRTKFTSGVVARFTDAGRLAAHAKVGCLAPLAKAAARDGNAWIVNVVACGRASSEWHLDEGVGVAVDGTRFSPIATTVYYVGEHDGRSSLEIVDFDEIWTGRNGDSHLRAREALDALASQTDAAAWARANATAPGVRERRAVLRSADGSAFARTARVEARDNAWVAYRGDAFHRVAPAEAADEFAARAPARRVAVTVEAYDLDPAALARAAAFEYFYDRKRVPRTGNAGAFPLAVADCY